ncbi:hypothetical protein BDQ94DRAFT_152078 [Aspergillus welwitschiae]|uniref:Uncharacterized protein n=1 Tax=Aspergillus welwitschiae TaxID=1341132 RepID=A0A3F3PNJ6_9EURO|nr:hypothetical protein BDQ94DRAFT_152078 [Aspergillus welwitschiae]RDH28497.1 hypothetical protein BDQ94DRAFT_152078 [Aspergillus welwitschiae]
MWHKRRCLRILVFRYNRFPRWVNSTHDSLVESLREGNNRRPSLDHTLGTPISSFPLRPPETPSWTRLRHSVQCKPVPLDRREEPP